MSHFGWKERGLDVRQMRAIEELLHRNASVFSKGDTDLGRTHLALHKIDTGSAQPVRLPPRRVPLQPNEALCCLLCFRVYGAG